MKPPTQKPTDNPVYIYENTFKNRNPTYYLTYI